MQIKKVATQTVSYTDTSNSPSNSAINHGIGGIGDSFEQKAALRPGSLELFAPPRLQPQSTADLMLQARAKEMGQFLHGQLEQFGVEIDESALTTFSASIIKGGKDGILNALGITYALAKLAMGSPRSDGVSESITSLVATPQQAEELAMPIITDPEFFPISDEQLQTMYSLESMPFGGPNMVYSFFTQILGEKIKEMEPISQEQINSLQKFETVIPIVFGSLGSEQTIKLVAGFSE